jgi:hypothetical protein
MKTTVLTCVVVLLVPVIVLAQEEVSGTYHGYGAETTTFELPDGRSLTSGTDHVFMVADDADSPFDHGKGQCLSEVVMSDSGEHLEAAGACVVRAADGDTYWFWWRLTEAGTEACTISCGTWGVFNGTGVFSGVTGSGTWETTSPYPDGSNAGTWRLMFSKE